MHLNIVKAESSNVEIHFIIEGDMLIIKVTDQGKGFDKSKLKSQILKINFHPNIREVGIEANQELMDTVEFESTEDGTTVTMTKNDKIVKEKEMADFSLSTSVKNDIVIIKTSGYLNNVGGEKIADACYKQINDGKSLFLLDLENSEGC